MSGLARERCDACVPGTPVLEAADQTELRAALDPAWEIVDGRGLRRRFEFKNFATAFALATRIALLCEQQGHHADLGVGWGYLKVDLTTHAAGGLTRNDFIMAARIDTF